MKDYPPFPLGKPLWPDYLDDSPERESPWFALPGTLSNPPPAHYLAAAFEGRAGFIGQNTGAADENGNPTHNICGFEVFRSFSATWSMTNPSVSDSHSIQKSYAFTTSPDWVGIETDYSNDNHSVAYTGQTPASNVGHIDANPEDTGSRAYSWSEIKSVPVTLDYLSGMLSSWLAQPRSFRENTAGSLSLYWGSNGAHRSETESGYYAAVSGMTLSERECLTEGFTWPDGVVYLHGYPDPFNGKVSLVRRKNGPVVKDLEGGDTADGSGPAICRSGKVSIELSNRISAKLWRDEFGTYDRRTSLALDAVGEGYGALAEVLVGPPASTYDTSAAAVFRSADGGDYRLTLVAGVMVAETFTELDTRMVLVTAAAPGTLQYESYLATPEETSADEVRITKLEKKADDGSYAILPLPSGAVSAVGSAVQIAPGAGVRVLFAIKRRNGVRWGHRELGYDYTSYADTADIPYYLTCRRTRDMRAESESNPAPAPTPADPTPAAAPTAPNRSPSRGGFLAGGGRTGGGGASGGW